MCRVARMHVPRVMRSFFLEKKTGRLSKLLRSNVGCFLLMSYVYVVENSTTCRNSGFPVQGQVWGTLSSKFGRAACHVPCGTHACAPCNAILFAREKKKQAAGPNCFGQILGVFCSYRTYISLKTARLAVTLGSLCRDRFWGTLSSKFGRAACRVPCGTRACAPV